MAKSLPLIEQLSIEKMASEGKCIGYHHDKVVFVPYTAPGDVADVQVTRNKSGYIEAVLATLHTPSMLRVKPVCSHFGLCGGCSWQHVKYRAQAEAKHQQVLDQLERIGKVKPKQVLPICTPEAVYEYRNKLEFTFTDNRWLTQQEIEKSGILERKGVGFYLPGRYDRIIDVAHCYLQAEPSNAIRNTLKAYALEHHISFYNRQNHSGLLRNVIIRTTLGGECMVILVVSSFDKPVLVPMLDHLMQSIPSITSLLYVVNSKRNDSIHDLEVQTYAGASYLTEYMEHLKFRVGPKSFYQTNAAQALALYRIVREFAGLTGKEIVYDLYSGTGTIALFLAQQAAAVVGIEYVEAAVEDARENASANGIRHAAFYAGDMGKVLHSTFISTHGRPDVIVTDPPRAGMDQSVIETILAVRPERIVYVSCNPSTQARDIAALASGYSLEKVQPVDMFPHTTHVENVALLVRHA
jgi:23S rRNA (uracil1939-C5)-methyltransferase